MAKKFNLLFAAASVVALAVPAFASAAPEITLSGATAKAGAQIAASSINLKVETTLGDITCAKFTMEGEVTQNTGKHFEVVRPSGEGSATTCFLGGTKSISVTDITLDRFTSNIIEMGTMALTFKADLPNNVTCHFVAVSAPFKYKTTSDTITFAKADFTSTPAACEPGLVSADFKLTSPGVALLLD